MFQKFDSVLVLSLLRVSAWGHDRPVKMSKRWTQILKLRGTRLFVQMIPERGFTINRKWLPTIYPIMQWEQPTGVAGRAEGLFLPQPFVASDKLR